MYGHGMIRTCSKVCDQPNLSLKEEETREASCKEAMRIFKLGGAGGFGSLLPFKDKTGWLCKLSMSCALTMYLDRYMAT